MKSRSQRLKNFMNEVWTKGNIEDLDGYISSKYEIIHDPMDLWNGQILDREEMKNRIISSRAPFPNQVFEIVDLIEGSDKIVICWKWKATHQHEVLGFAPTHNEVTSSGITCYHFDHEDLICAHWQVVDRLGIFQQLNLNRGE